MRTIRPSELPASALLRRYQDGKSYADCYVTEVPGAVSHRAFVEAFYTTRLFKLERALLTWLASRPSTDTQAGELAEGRRESFAAWRVEGRDVDQLLMADMTGHTRSWLMVAPVGGDSARTRLYFGSAVVARTDAATGRHRIGFAFRALLGFHKLYSRLLLSAARSRLLSNRCTGASTLE